MSDLTSILFEGMDFYHPLDVELGGDVMQYEPEVTQYLRTVLRGDMTFLDVGAHFGYYTLLATNRVRNVISIEPKASNRAVLLENIERNGLKNVTVVEKILFSGIVRGSMRKNRFRVRSDGPLETVTLDSLCLSPNVIKIDVEGAELDILMGAEKTLRTYKPILAIEVHKHKIGTFNHHWTQVPNFLRNLGYAVVSLGQRTERIWFIGAEFGG